MHLVFICRRFLVLLFSWIIMLGVACPLPLIAGGGPENLLLIVNANSASSKLIANHYIALRGIPSQNVIYLNDLPDQEMITLDEFRELILKPVFAEMSRRKLVAQIDYIVYSADFPTSVNIAPHWKKLSERTRNNPPDGQLDRRLFLPVASINALTYYAAAVMIDEPSYMMLNSNHYYRKPASVLLRQPFFGPLQSRYETALGRLESESVPEIQAGTRILEAMAKQNPAQVAVTYSLARGYGKLGDAKRATAWLKRSTTLGWVYRKQTQADQLFDRVRDDQEFQQAERQIPDLPFDFVATHGFKNQYALGPNGMINSTPGQGNRHYLSTVLAVTRNEGCTEREALAQLQRSVRADATHPQGTFYFTKTSDIRTKTRTPNFKPAMKALIEMGYRSEVVSTKMPMQARDVLGVTSGTANFVWTQFGNRFVPGAIADNLTSFGGRMNRPGQTKLTHFLQHGAAGASGTVVEPYAKQEKFPHPMIHVHYVRGCTLAEAFYQSVAGPTQLLIVGDALCRPFARPPSITLKGIKPNDEIKGLQLINFESSKPSTDIQLIQVFLDGRLVHQQPNLDMFVLDTQDLSDGYHEVRAVAISRNQIETTGNTMVPIRINNHGHRVKLSTEHSDYLITDTLTLQATANWGQSIGLLHNGRLIAKESGQEVKFSVPANLLGRGPVQLEAVALEAVDGLNRAVSSPPISLTIEGRLSRVKRKTNLPDKAAKPAKISGA